MRSDSNPSNPEFSNLSDEERCPCGAIHHVAVGTVVIDHTSIDQLVAYGQSHRWSKPCVVMDANTEELLGSSFITALSLAGMRPEWFYFPERPGRLVDE